jgi:hypothetical protein
LAWPIWHEKTYKKGKDKFFVVFEFIEIFPLLLQKSWVLFFNPKNGAGGRVGRSK